MAEILNITTDRGDDIPLLLAQLERMGVQPLLDSPRQDILYSGGELTRPCLPNIRLTRTQSCTAHRRRSSLYESQGV